MKPVHIRVNGLSFSEVVQRCPKGSQWQHIRTKSLYVIVGYAIMEEDVTLHILYERVDGPLFAPWSRNASVFLDRFSRTLEAGDGAL